MNTLSPHIREWLSGITGPDFAAAKHIHSHQDDVFKIQTPHATYYLKSSSSLAAERDNLAKLDGVITAPKVVDFYRYDGRDYLLISELPGKNLVELAEEWPPQKVAAVFARAIRQLHDINARRVFSEAAAGDVLLHGDMALPNIIISGEQIGYIDFGKLTFGHPELDLADAIWSLQRNIGPDYGEYFLEQYGPVEMTPKIQKALAFRYSPEQ